MLRVTRYYNAFFGYLKIILSKTQKKQSFAHEQHETISGDAML